MDSVVSLPFKQLGPGLLGLIWPWPNVVAHPAPPPSFLERNVFAPAASPPPAPPPNLRVWITGPHPYLKACIRHRNFHVLHQTRDRLPHQKKNTAKTVEHRTGYGYLCQLLGVCYCNEILVASVSYNFSKE